MYIEKQPIGVRNTSYIKNQYNDKSTTNLRQSNKEVVKEQDSVELSSSNKHHSSKVDEIKKSVQNGTYNIDSRLIAQSMIKSMLQSK